MGPLNEIIFSISEYIELLNIGLKKSKAKIIGEVSEVGFGPTGHVYFSLKDEKDGSVLKCIIWKSKYILFGIRLEEGLKIIASGYPEIYPLSGRLSFIAEVLEHAGEGTLKKEYEKLKKKLAEEGIFAEERKRPLPKYLRRVGLITSKQGAVLADFLSNLGKYGFKIKMIDSRVEGQGAVEDLLLSIKTFKKQDIEALVIMRGGGSLESMLAFNNELLVREVAGFPVPVIAAIGHDKDVPLMSLAADLAVSTPTAAANRLTEPWRQVALLVETGDRVCFQKFHNTLENGKINLRTSWEKSIFGFRALLSRINQQLEHSAKIIELNNPERQIKLGYSIARCRGKIVRSVQNVKVGEDLDIRVVDGDIISEVKDIK
ncbi:MAG: exodeoxyribonuclease VII large subunit [Candidatus Nealsonbacteria bacterium CG08_land_8_20_14_0_20_38_20]|uniref:Exodeoxyribonuclease 7 large subunit n=1 Tax=Candidatus Nealsonbacteria bacterium CG08_land_8_20_14_0_20_38_20 TaxID=1974705 RepID=A0A2H0YNR9_9BACT|nr:MAG: exodeoxyribonuclease VII large subunit [Candidatus Nealsonbacteria bacterium CG08_land_8_20_14_0_20_38_20]